MFLGKKFTSAGSCGRNYDNSTPVLRKTKKPEKQQELGESLNISTALPAGGGVPTSTPPVYLHLVDEDASYEAPTGTRLHKETAPYLGLQLLDTSCTDIADVGNCLLFSIRRKKTADVEEYDCINEYDYIEDVVPSAMVNSGRDKTARRSLPAIPQAIYEPLRMDARKSTTVSHRRKRFVIGGSVLALVVLIGLVSAVVIYGLGPIIPAGKLF